MTYLQLVKNSKLLFILIPFSYCDCYKGVQLTQQNMVMQTLTIASDGELFTRAFGNYQVKVCVIF